MAADLRRIQEIHDQQKARLYAENYSLKADAEKWRAREARNKALIDRGFLGSPLRATE